MNYCIDADNPHWISINEKKPQPDTFCLFQIKRSQKCYEPKLLTKGTIDKFEDIIECWGNFLENNQYDLWTIDTVNCDMWPDYYFDRSVGFKEVWENNKLTCTCTVDVNPHLKKSKKEIRVSEIEVLAWFPMPEFYSDKEE